MLKNRSLSIEETPLNNSTATAFFSLLRRLGKGEIPFISKNTLEELLFSDPKKEEHTMLLNLLIAAAKKRRWDKENPGYWILATKEEATLAAGLLVGEKPVAPLLQNLRLCHFQAPILFEVRTKEKKEKLLATLMHGKLEIISGDEKLLRPFLAEEVKMKSQKIKKEGSRQN